MTLKVIGAGFGRTGTMSLKLALEELGFTKCHHMSEARDDPESFKLWYEASHGRPVNWDDVFKGYQAAVDWPSCAFYEELVQQYPEAKVILTVRNPERWYESARSTIFVSSHVYPKWMVQLIPALRHHFGTDDRLIWQGTFHGRFTDKEYAIHIFNQHIDKVKAIVPAENLLIYEVKEGWQPLCRFLDVPVPQDKPFPHVNDKSEFQKLIARRRSTVRSAYAAIVGVAAITVWFLAKLGIQQG